MAKLNDNTLVLRDGAPVSLLKGDDVPDWAKDQVGDHLLEGGAKQEDGSAPKGNASREDWAAYAKAKGAPDEETRSVEEGGLKQAELRDKYGN
jgi:hypothetical protein